ncbi:heavy metal translocating P-type ATPase [Chlorogloeopsis sp. ULAP02]|uniref:heavy metal translocating P-type ATPase n=1 Tax=Chlorogloeopsis sp. ULAP02 TaxID=3107926 RepID=UPI00313502B9
MVQVKVGLPSSASQLSQVTAAQKNGKAHLVELNTHSRTHLPKVPHSVVHAITGRIRLQVPRLRYDPDYAQRLQILLEADALVTSIRLKPAAASVAITYNPRKVSEFKLRHHLSHLIQAAGELVVLKSATLQTTEQTEKFWPGVQLSGAITTLAVLGGPLGLPIPSMLMVGTITLATLPIVQRAWKGIVVERKLNIDFLDFIAIAITTFQGQFITPALMLSLIEIGEKIRDRTARSSAQQTLDLLSSLGQLVWVERGGNKQQISIQEVQCGDTVIVYPGEQVPVDGKILRGKALLDEQKLTGESVPVFKTKGQQVFASTLVREGRIYILAEGIGNDTKAGKSLQLMQQAPVHDTRMGNDAVKIAEKAVLPTLLLGGTVLAITRNPARAASIFSLDFATGIRVSVPTAVLAALTHAAQRGVLIRSGRALELLAQVDTVVFDKTGTLTQGEAAVVGVESFNSAISSMRVLQLAATAEQCLTHPVAEAVMRYAETHNVEILPRSKWEYQLGLGVQAQIDGELVYVGSKRFLRHKNVDLSGLEGKQKPASAIYVATNGELQGIIEYCDLLRPESREVIHRLLTVEGVEVHMLTGDNKRTASTVAAQLGIIPTNTHAEAFPEQKATVVRELHEQGKTVAFVGDGINDSPALAYADVSVSFANGSDIARETADLVLMKNDLHGLLEAIALARQTKQLIQQNTGIVAVPNLAALAIAVFFGLNPLAATVVNNGSTVVAGVNGLRPVLKSRKTKTLPTVR